MSDPVLRVIDDELRTLRLSIRDTTNRIAALEKARSQLARTDQPMNGKRRKNVAYTKRTGVEAELRPKILETLTANDRPLSANQIAWSVNESSPNTVRTILERLVVQKIVQRSTNGDRHVYYELPRDTMMKIHAGEGVIPPSN